MIAARLIFAAALTLCGAAAAQEPPQDAAQPTAPVEAAPPSEDDMADLLNSRQQLSQGVTLQRTLDGKVVETRKETVIYAPGDPMRSNETALSPIERLRASFDQDALTRREALDEAELDFLLADKDRNGWMTEEEFVGLVREWRDGDIRSAALGDNKRQTRFVDFHDGLAENARDDIALEEARAKYAAMIEGRGALTKREYSREVSRGFDAADANQNGLLREEELISFRASARGEIVHKDAVISAPLAPLAPAAEPPPSVDAQ